MAKRKSSKPAPKRPARTRKTSKAKPAESRWRRLRRWALRGAAGFAGLIVLAVLLFALFNPPTTPTMLAEGLRLGQRVDHQWVDLEDVAPVMARSVVAAEDANFCLHWGFDMAAIRAALDDGAQRGASTISQQVVKNVYLWQGRSWPRKALEAVMTPVLEAVWSKRRILEVYLNVAEFGEGVFGVEAAARTYFHTGPETLAPWQAAQLAAVLPDPRGRSATRPTGFVRARARAIADGAETIRSDGRAACFGG